MKWHIYAFFGLVGLAAGNGVRSPVEKVVDLLKNLQAKTEALGKAEQQIYDKYACWCETTTARKAADITQAENDLRALGQQILKLKGQVATLEAEIKELTDKLAENKQEQDEATSMREKRNGKFMARQSEIKQTLAALEEAIDVLAKGSSKDSSLMQTDAAAQATSAVQSVLDKLPSEGALDGDRMSLLSGFLSNGADSSYAPQSATIQGILTDMYSTFSTDLEDATMTEAKQNKNYEKLMASLQKEAIEMEDVKSRKLDEKAQAASDLADTTAAYDDTTDQMKADIKFFGATKDACDTKHEEWTLRTKMRDQEIEGIEKALGLLTSDDARDLFADAIKPGHGAASFLQVDEAHSQAVYAKAYSMLKADAVKFKSLRLAALAVRVRTTKAGHFDAVIKAIDEMVVTLNEEGAADRAKKNQCNEEYQKIARTVADLDWQIKNNDAKIEKLSSMIDAFNKERQETIDQINDNNDYMKKITADRKEENEAFVQAKKDDEDAIALLNAAKSAFTKYLNKGKNATNAMFLQQDPVFEVSEDQAPDAIFSSKDNNMGESKGIVALMGYIIEDVENELKNDAKDEAKSLADYESEMADAEELDRTLKAKQSSLEDAIAKRKQERTDEVKDMESNYKDRGAELEYQAKIKPDCDWIKKNFDGRAQARAAEMSGLTSAKEFLAGKASLLEVKARGHKTTSTGNDRLANIGFLHLH